MHIVIIGNGIAGITTARYIRKYSDYEITVISAETDYFWSRTALMYIYMGHMKYSHTKPYEDWFWKKNKINLLRKYVEKIDIEGKRLIFADGDGLVYDKLVLATGSQTNKFGWPGQDLKGVQGMVSKQDLDSMEAYSEGLEHAIVVGGGLIGIEMAEMFHTRNIPVTMLVREKSYWSKNLPPEESQMVNEEIQATHGIHLRLSTEMKEILSDENGKVRAVVTTEGEEVPCQFVGLTTGVHPNIDLVKETGVEINRGILVDEYLQTSVPDIYACGDCAELRNPVPGRRGVEAIWYTGKLMGPVLGKTLTGTPTPYQQITYFNSAKFINLEWQVYGTVNAKPEENEMQLFWQHSEQRKSIRLVYDAEKGNVLGFNLMGIRYRQNVCTHWIDQQIHIEEVLENLGAANFDPEFFTEYEGELVKKYNEQHPGKNLTLKRKRGWKNVLAVLKNARPTLTTLVSANGTSNGASTKKV